MKVKEERLSNGINREILEKHENVSMEEFTDKELEKVNLKNRMNEVNT